MSNGTFQVTFALVIHIEADSKERAVVIARDCLLYDHGAVEDHMELDDPICVFELDDNGDPIL